MSEAIDPCVTPWQIDGSEFYDIETHRERMEFLLRYAVLAPSNRNTQPWAFRITANGVEVFADYTRRLLTIDPNDRELFLSVGAAIMNVRVAAAHFGYVTSVRYDARPQERLPVAYINVCETCGPDVSLASLFRAIRKRHTNRALFDGAPIDPRSLSRVREVLAKFPETLQLILPDENHHAAKLIEYAERLQMNRPAVRAEMAEWIRADDGLHSDGVSAEAFGIPRFFGQAAACLVRKFSAGSWHGSRDRRLTESASVLLVVSAGDDRVSLLRAGEALEFLLLTITETGLQYSFLNHAIEAETLRERVQILSGSPQPAQLLLRIGSSTHATRSMPRRTVDSVLAGAV
jgi:hypothetical protein